MIITAVDVVRVAVPAYDPPFVWRAGLPGSEPNADGAWLVISYRRRHIRNLVRAARRHDAGCRGPAHPGRAGGSRRVGMPVYQPLGSYRESLPAYASTVTFGSVEETWIDGPPAGLAEALAD